MKNRSAIFEFVCRCYVFVFLNLYALGKMVGMQFYRRGQLPTDVATTTLADASAFELGWTFMGYSPGYIFFIGISQLIGAWCLLFARSKLLGVAILLPIMVNIIVFDIFFLDQKGAIVNASIYFLMLLFILWHNRAQVTDAFNSLTTRHVNPVTAKPDRWVKLAAALVLAGVIFFLDQTLVGIVGR
ncbi:MAG: hypothetical protein AAF597_05140 [Bacteroidota bacterium]